MQIYPLKLVTVVGETVIMDDIAKEGVELGATGYTLTEVIGQGSRSTRNVIVTGSSRRSSTTISLPMPFILLKLRLARVLMSPSCRAYMANDAALTSAAKLWRSESTIGQRSSRPAQGTKSAAAC